MATKTIVSEKTTLVVVFNTAAGKELDLIILKPLEKMEGGEIKAYMEEIIDAGGLGYSIQSEVDGTITVDKVVSINRAEYVVRSIDKLDLA